MVTNPARPYCIGLTGNIATGKSTVGQVLTELGAQHIDADKVVHELMAPGEAAYHAIIAAFDAGGTLLNTDGSINRATLGRIVFDDPEALARLEAILHPLVIAEVDHRIATSTAPVVIIEAIKLLEAGMARHYDAVWVTTCPEVQQVKRLMQSRGMSRDEALRRIHAQPPQAEKIAQADVVLDTSGSKAATREQILAVWKTIRTS